MEYFNQIEFSSNEIKSSIWFQNVPLGDQCKKGELKQIKNSRDRYGNIIKKTVITVGKKPYNVCSHKYYMFFTFKN